MSDLRGEFVPEIAVGPLRASEQMDAAESLFLDASAYAAHGSVSITIPLDANGRAVFSFSCGVPCVLTVRGRDGYVMYSANGVEFP